MAQVRLVSLIWLAMIATLSALPCYADGSAVVWTDKPDYESWETVTIYGSGFNSNADIDLTIAKPDSVVDNGSTTSNASGNFVYYYLLNGMNGTYTVTATDGVNSASTTFTETRYHLEGYTNLPHAKWTDGILKGWSECEEVPYRLKMSEVEATSYALSNYHDNELKGFAGIDYCTSFYVGYENGSVAPATEATFSVTGPFYQTPVQIKEIYYTWNVTYTSEAAGRTYYLYWKAHLAIGCSNWPGAKLHGKTDITGAQDVPIAVPPAVLGEISGYKFNDLDGDGVWDVVEPVLTDGWTINLYMLNETGHWVFQTSTTTDINGSYKFTNLFYGDYKVTEDVKDGWSNTLSPGYPITLNDTDPISKDNNFGNHELPQIPPVACFTVSNESPNVCETVTFNGSCSYDPDGWIVNYTWNFGDTNITTVTYPIITHHYETFGNYTATLTVTDNDGLTNSTSKPLWVRGHPVARFTYSPSYPQVCEAVVFNASDSTPDGGYILSYTWNFGDSNTTTVADPIIIHHYNNYGNHTVTLNITDSEGKWDTESKIITVRAHPHADFTWSPTSPQVGELVTFNGCLSTPDGGAIISYEWNFGDNSPHEFGNIVDHTYSTYGTYTITLNVTDSEGKWDTESKNITVRAHPHADFTWSPLYPQVCETVTFNASASTPDGGVIISWDWDFNDTTTGTGEIVTHHYDMCGDYYVTLTVNDSEGKSDTTTKKIHVSASIESSGSNGNRKDVFIKCGLVYAYGSCYAPNTTYSIYVVKDTTWTDGMPIPPSVTGTATTVTSNGTGQIPPTKIWTHPDIGEYDIVVDVNSDGLYNAAIDTLDDNDIDGAGFTVTEFAGDINSDGIVSITDIVIAALAFGSQPGDPNWNPDADLTDDGTVNIVDLVIVGLNFGKTV